MGVFICHIHDEQALAASLQQLIRTLLGWQSEVFVSGQPDALFPGSDFEQELREKLLSSELVLVLCGSESVSHPWTHFMAGGAWAAGKGIVPVCHSGLGENLVQPLGSFQKLDLDSEHFVGNLKYTLSQYLNVPFAATVDESQWQKSLSEAAEQSTSGGGLRLLEVGNQKILVIKKIRELTGLGLKESKDLTDSAGQSSDGVEVPLKPGLNVRKAAASLEQAGARVRPKSGFVAASPPPSSGCFGVILLIALATLAASVFPVLAW